MRQSKFWTSSTKSGLKTKINYFAKRVLNLMKPRQKMLDLGSGRSADALFFVKNNHKVTCVDVAEKRISGLREYVQNKKIRDIEIVISDIRKLNFPDESFDIIYAHLVLHYFNDKTTKIIYENLKKILRKGGLLCVKVYSVDDYRFGRGKQMESNVFNRNGHIVHYFTKQYLADCMQGLDMIRLKRSKSVYFGKIKKSAYIEAIGRKK